MSVPAGPHVVCPHDPVCRRGPDGWPECGAPAAPAPEGRQTVAHAVESLRAAHVNGPGGYLPEGWHAAVGRLLTTWDAERSPVETREPLTSVLASYRPFPHPGHDSWEVSARHHWSDEYELMHELREAMKAAQEWVGGPLEVCDGIVWDGHHRLIAARSLELGPGWLGEIPVRHVTRQWLTDHGHPAAPARHNHMTRDNRPATCPACAQADPVSRSHLGPHDGCDTPHPHSHAALADPSDGDRD